MSFELNGLAAEPISTGINKLFQAIAMGPMVKEKAQMQAGLMGAQQMRAQAEADASNYTLDNRKNIAQWLDNDPDIQALAQQNPHYANALRAAYKVFGQTGHHEVSKFAGDFQKQALLGEARQSIPAGSQGLDLQNRLVSIASDKTYEPFQNIADTGYVMDRAQGGIHTGNPAMADFFKQAQEAQAALRTAQAHKAMAEASSPMRQLDVEQKQANLDYKRAQLDDRQTQAEETVRQHLALNETGLSSIDRGLQYIDRLLENPKGLNGVTGSILSHKPTLSMSDEQLNAKADLDTIKSKIALNVIQDMRKGSAAGATGFGNMNEKQTRLIEDALGSLDRAQSYEQVVKNLHIIKQAFQELRGNALQDTARLKAKLPQQPIQESVPNAQMPREIVRRGKLKDGRSVIQYSNGDMEFAP
ncbi:MAG: hypothetical protein ON057_001790 [Glomeribacter sp. 1016415]|nr:hypothetical protein [Glomeribacter sp. 1016415]